MLLLAENFTLKVLTRLAHKALGISKLIEGIAVFCCPVEAMHAVTIMSLKAKGLQLSVGTVLTSRHIR